MFFKAFSNRGVGRRGGGEGRGRGLLKI